MQRLIIEIDIPEEPRWKHIGGKFDDAKSILESVAKALTYMSPSMGETNVLTHVGGVALGTLRLIEVYPPETKSEKLECDAAEN